MPKYLLVHSVEKYPETQDEWLRLWGDLRQRSCDEAEWLHSFYEPSSGKMFCEWNGIHLEAILECLGDELLVIAPLERSSEIVMFDPEWLDELENSEGEIA